MAYLDKKILLIISFIITLSAWSDISKLKIDDQIENNIKIIKDEATKALKNINKLFQINLLLI